MSSSNRNKIVTFLVLLIAAISVHGYQKPENKSIDYLELDLGIKNNWDNNESLEKYIDSRFKGHLQGCPYEYNITKIKNHSHKNITINARNRVDLTLFLTRSSPALINPCCIDFHENYLRACFEQKNKLDESWKGGSFSVKELRNYKTFTETEDVPEKLDVDLQIIQYFISLNLKEYNQLVDYISARFKGSLKGCRCDYRIVSISDKWKQKGASTNITLYTERDKQVPIEKCNREGNWDSLKDCLVNNNKMDDFWKGARVFVNEIRDNSTREVKAEGIVSNLQETYLTNDARSFVLKPYLSIGFFIGLLFSNTCCVLLGFFGKSSRFLILS